MGVTWEQVGGSVVFDGHFDRDIYYGMPCMSKYDTEKELDRARGCIGATVLVYNKTDKDAHLTGFFCMKEPPETFRKAGFGENDIALNTTVTLLKGQAVSLQSRISVGAKRRKPTISDAPGTADPDGYIWEFSDGYFEQLGWIMGTSFDIRGFNLADISKGGES